MKRLIKRALVFLAPILVGKIVDRVMNKDSKKSKSSKKGRK